MKVRMVGVEEVRRFIQSLPRGMKIVGMRAASEHMIGDEKRGLKHYPPWMGQKYKRTGNLHNSWNFVEHNSQWDRVSIYNTAEYALLVQGDEDQLPIFAHYKWRKALTVMAANMVGAVRAAQEAVNALIARKGK